MEPTVSAARLVDAHGHIQFEQFDADRDLVIGRCRAAGVAAVTVGVDRASSEAAAALAVAHPDVVRATAGVHPLYVYGAESEAATTPDAMRASLATLAARPEVLAVGECGLDYARLPAGEEAAAKARQRETFALQVEVAAAAGKPLMIHCRDAYDDVLGLLDDVRRSGLAVRAHFHFFAGDEGHLRRILDAGDSVSFTGVITFADSYDNLVKYPPLDRLLSETDCPYVAPAPFRGKRNEPSYVEEVVRRLAALRNLDFEDAAAALRQNAGGILGLQLLARV